MRKIYLILVVLFATCAANAANIYVDNNTIETGVTWDGTDGTSYSSTDTDFPGTGTGYSTIKEALANIVIGDTIYMRGGTYEENSLLISTTKNGSAWTVGNFNTLTSYPDEWAKIDGTNSGISHSAPYAGAVICGDESSPSESYFRKYWLFERFEVTNGSAADNQASNGIALTGGPLKFRYLYVHDNNASNNDGYNSGGIRIQEPNDCVIEYCCIADNGYVGSTDSNNSNILFYSDYNWDNIAADGFDPDDTANVGCRKNIIRYNYIKGSVLGFKHKGAQLFSSRTGTGEMTYSDFGDNLNHNIVTGAYKIGLMVEQDFCQVHNNIVAITMDSISSNYERTGRQMFKPVFYNNTIINPTHSGITHHGSALRTPDFTINYSYTYNNIISEVFSPTYIYAAINICPNTDTGFTLSGSYVNKNYTYNPDGGVLDDFVRLNNAWYTNSEFEAQVLTASPKVNYVEAYDSGDLLFVGTTGADQYKINSTHVIELGVTVADGGIGGDHPYLSGVTIPSYIGAANPNDDDWVAGVLALDVAYMTSASAGSDPSWIEGSEKETCSQCSPLGGNSQFTLGGNSTITFK